MIFLPFVRDTSWNHEMHVVTIQEREHKGSPTVVCFFHLLKDLLSVCVLTASSCSVSRITGTFEPACDWIFMNPRKKLIFTPASWLFILCTWRNAVSWLTLKEMRFLESLLKFHELGFVLDGEKCGISSKNAHLESSIKFQLKFQYKAKLESAWIEIVDKIDVIFSPECSWQKRTLPDRTLERGDVSLQSASCSPGILYFCVS